MEFTFAHHLDALADWREDAARQVAAFQQTLGSHELLDDSLLQLLGTMRQRLASEQLVVAFVAEFSRGKSELINAIFFADTGRRMLPATPGRTTMCPVELGHDDALPPLLALLPIETRLEPAPLAELRGQSARWKRLRLDVTDPDRVAEALKELTRTKAVSLEEARALGLAPSADTAEAASGARLRPDGLVDVPAWRHAIVNYPHPLLRRGLVVLDTPGLNAVGAEPELTLSLLPTAHAIVFVVGADTGVTQSELAVWHDHLGGHGPARYVVLNKIDTLADPLLTPAEVQGQVEGQCARVAEMLGVPPSAVHAVSARQALVARIANGGLADAAASATGGLATLEDALVTQLLPRRRQVLAEMVLSGTATVEAQASRRVADQRRQLHEQLTELRDVRGKSASKVQRSLERLDAEAQDFERCTGRLAALRSVQSRLVADAVQLLSATQLREEVARMQLESAGRLLKLGARKAFTQLCTRLRQRLERAAALGAEAQAMLTASYQQLNTDFGFALASGAAPTHLRALGEIDLIERNYGRYLGLPYALRLGDARQMEQFRRMLVSKLEVIFELAAAETERWSQALTVQADMQLRDRRRGFQRRRETLERAHSAAGDLATRIQELETQHRHWEQLAEQVHAQAVGLRALMLNNAVAEVDIPLALPERRDAAPPLTLVRSAAGRGRKGGA